MGQQIEHFLSTPIPEEVWHYTTLSGLKGILSSGRIWATEAHFATDRSELVHAWDIARGCLKEFAASDKSEAAARGFSVDLLDEVFGEGVLSPSKMEIFTVSFCVAEDLKSQWMKYGGSGRGVALAFDLRHIRPPKETESAVTFAPCLYEEKQKIAMLMDSLVDWRTSVTELSENSRSGQWMEKQRRFWRMIDNIFQISHSEQELLEVTEKKFHAQLKEAGTRTVFNLLRIASHCKNQSFYQEAEWRLALPHMKNSQLKYSEIRFHGAHNEVPYVAHNLFCKKLPITRIKAGPLVEDTESIKRLLSEHEFDVPITRSTIHPTSLTRPAQIVV